MKLREYIEKEDMTISQFARRVKANPHTILSILSGTRDFMASLALRIEKETKGKVKLRELIQEDTILKGEARKMALNTYIRKKEEKYEHCEEKQKAD